MTLKQLKNDFPGIFPACVTTRSGKSTSDDVIDISDSFFSKLVNDDKSVIQEETSDHSAVSVDNSFGVMFYLRQKPLLILVVILYKMMY